MNRIEVHENGMHVIWNVDEEGGLQLLHFSALPFTESDIDGRCKDYAFKFVEMNLAGYDRTGERHGNKFIRTAPGYRLKYLSHTSSANEQGRFMTFVQKDEETDVYLTTYVQFYDGLSLVRMWTEIENKGREMQTIEYISGFNYTGIEKEGLLPRDEKMEVYVPHHSWQRELNWKTYTLPELGLELVQPKNSQRSSSAFKVSNTGNWSAKEHLPMGYIENSEVGSGLFWQIEHNGSWHWEIGDQDGHLYLAVSGPNEIYNHWSRDLKPGETFITVPVAVGVTPEGFEHAMGQLTRYRRRIRRPNRDNEKLPVIFNDYMNCLWGNPTAEKEFPLVDAAAAAGCEYFCIDAGWYADGAWWDNVGEWKESRLRFPNGVREVTDYIRSKGMVPGVWLEIEVMGIHCKKAAEVPDNWFFLRHGRKVYDRSRFQLDFRNPEVRAYADGVIDRLVQEYGIGYIKMDYNIEPGIGTDYQSDSVGDGLLNHERSYLAWLDGVFARYPDLIIENCSSGGLRMDYAMLSRYSIQSTSDQDDYRRYATIAANAPSALCPEQSAIWAYPMNHEEEVSEDRLKEEVIFNMVNAMLMRIHQSGHLAKLDPLRKELVSEALTCYKEIRKIIPESVPFWPLGLSEFSDEWVSMGIRTEEKAYLAVWRREGSQTCKDLPIDFLYGKNVQITCAYPSSNTCRYRWNENTAVLTAELPKENMARLFEISF